MPKQTAKIFTNGRSQAVRLPREFRFSGTEVYIRKEGDRVILSPRPSTWAVFFADPSTASTDFMIDRHDTYPQSRENL